MQGHTGWATNFEMDHGAALSRIEYELHATANVIDTGLFALSRGDLSVVADRLLPQVDSLIGVLQKVASGLD